MFSKGFLACILVALVPATAFSQPNVLDYPQGYTPESDETLVAHLVAGRCGESVEFEISVEATVVCEGDFVDCPEVLLRLDCTDALDQKMADAEALVEPYCSAGVEECTEDSCIPRNLYYHMPQYEVEPSRPTTIFGLCPGYRCPARVMSCSSALKGKFWCTNCSDAGPVALSPLGS